MTHKLGTYSLASEPNKLTRAGAQLFEIDDYDQPFVTPCSAWLAHKLIAEPHNQQIYDLFIGEIVGAWLDIRVFKNGHWQFEKTDSALRSLHYIAGGNIYSIGDSISVPNPLE